MIVREFKQGDENKWDNYISTHEYSTPLQLSAWKTIFETVFNSTTHFLLLEEEGNIKGVLPLLHIKNVITGNYFTSLPGGLLANSEITANFLLDYAKNIIETQNAKYLILRDGKRKWSHPDLFTDEEHLNLVIPIRPDLEENKSSMKKRTKKLVERSLENGLMAGHGLDLLDDFYPVYALAMQQIGTPTFGQSFFDQIGFYLGQTVHLITVSQHGDTLGGGYIAPLSRTIHCLWSGFLREKYDLLISHFMYWEAMKYAHQNGYERVNLGRCRKKSGQFVFKKGFGGEIQPLYQQFFLNGVSQLPPIGAEMEDDLKYRVFTKFWRLLPHKITEIVGPEIRKMMPFG